MSIVICPLRLGRCRREEEREEEKRAGKGGGTAGKGDERTMGWRGRAFWNGKLFLVGRRRPSWAKKEQAIYISKQPSLEVTSLLYPFMEYPIIFHSPTQFMQIILLIRSGFYRPPNSTLSSSSFASPLCPTIPTLDIDTTPIKHAARGKKGRMDGWVGRTEAAKERQRKG